jgi:hypothetical protein
MRHLVELLACAGSFMLLVMDPDHAGPKLKLAESASLAVSGPSTVPAAAARRSTVPALCPDPMATITALYDANDASRFDRSLRLFTTDATLSTWAEGVNGYHARERRLTGKKEIRAALREPGLRRTTDRPDGPIYRETEVKVAGNRVTFMLRPDRLRPNGKPYNPYRVEAVFVGCKIKSLAVIDSVTWL